MTLEQFKAGLKKEALRRKRKKALEENRECVGYMKERKIRRKQCR